MSETGQPHTAYGSAPFSIGPLHQQRSEAHRLTYPLGEIFDSLSMGLIAFDPELRILDSNRLGGKLIETADTIDKSLAQGTDEPVWRGWTEQLRAVATEGKILRYDQVRYRREGKSRVLRITLIPLKSATMNHSGALAIIEDVTKAVQVEKQLASAERLAAVGKLASKVAHELNNPLDGILRYLNLAIRTGEKEGMSKQLGYLQQCRRGLMRLVQITSELLEFSRRTNSAFDHNQIEQIIEEAIRAMEGRTSAANIEVSRNYSCELPSIRTGNLFQVFCNLIKNAVDVMPEGGKLTITTSRSDDNTAIIEFRDTGTGFAPENSEKIFEPFFTTKPEGKGTGLGLAICRDIVANYGGQITARNAPEVGSIFRVLIPLDGNML